MTTYFTGCTHFGHANIIKLANRPYSSVEEMNETLIENWNNKVKPQDTVYHLGDFAWNDPYSYETYLNGTLVKIQGNHDKGNWGSSYLERQFAKKLVLFHYPIEEWNGYYKGKLHLHCHTHKPDLVSGHNRFNVGVDATGFVPISYEELEAQAV